MKSIFIIIPLVILNLGIITGHNPDLAAKPGLSNLLNNTSRQEIPDTTMQIRPFQLEIVAPSSGVQFYKNGILFLSYSKAGGKMTEKHLSFGTLRPFMALVSDTVPGEYMPFPAGASVIFPTEATTFSKNYDTMYVSMIPERKSKEKIFGAVNIQNEWVIDSNPLSFCKDNNIYTHPALSEDGQFMIFSSDITGSAGGLDLFITRKENNKWTDPINLGAMINTTGNELFASLDNENNLYFSSDGLPGLGGYDIFMSMYDGENWSKPENLTAAINTQNDEVAFTVNPFDGMSAFFTLRATSVKSNSQLFRVTLKRESSSVQGSGIPSALLALTGLNNKIQSPFSLSVVSASPVKTETMVEAPPVKVAEVKQENRIEPKVEPKVEPRVEPKTEPKVERKPTPTAPVEKGSVVYRVQILANTKPVGSYDLTVAGKSYKTFEYLYAGGYRTTVGEFSTLNEAVNFQNTCRKSGYNQAFVVAFRDNIRTNDPELFKK
jgi:hypothetical protein